MGGSDNDGTADGRSPVLGRVCIRCSLLQLRLGGTRSGTGGEFYFSVDRSLTWPFVQGKAKALNASHTHNNSKMLSCTNIIILKLYLARETTSFSNQNLGLVDH